MRTQTSPWSTTRTSLAMPSGLRLRSSLSGSGKTSLNWSQTSNWSHLQQLKQRKERTWRKRVGVEPTPESDRKSTRLNSSHGYISYAVFCLKKKKRSTVAEDTPGNVSVVDDDRRQVDAPGAKLL